MNVVVGAVATQTPEFSDEMEYVELNPTWTVPYSIATKEMLPKLRSNPFAYAADFDVFVNGALSSWGSINWDAYGPGKFPFTFRQRPGPKNALGKVKFMLPNKHNIYLHDTPSKDKFASTSRAFSHGCIRLSRPIELAHTLIGEVPGWSGALVDGVLASGKLTRVSLPTHIPGASRLFHRLQGRKRHRIPPRCLWPRPQALQRLVWPLGVLRLFLDRRLAVWIIRMAHEHQGGAGPADGA